MKSWPELEQRFRALENVRMLCLHMQWGSAGESWYLAEPTTNPSVSQFKILVATAGRLLGKALPSDSELLKEPTPEIRWYRAVKSLSGENTHLQYGFETDSKTGEHIGTVYTGRIYDIATVSANLCLWLETNYPVKDTRSVWAKLYETHGREIVIGVIVGIILMLAAVLFRLPM